jgi:phage terminase Nu1 subunit (DNA packaging protein)
MKTPTGRRVNRSELAAIQGVAVSTIDAMVRRGLPYLQRPSGKGKGWIFDTAQVREWELSRAVENLIGDAGQVDRGEAERRKAIAQAALAEHELGERRRELISVDLAASIIRREYAAVRSRLLAMPAKVAPELALAKEPAEARAVLEAELREVLGELSGGDLVGADAGDGEALREEDSRGEGSEPPAAAADLDCGVGGPEPIPVARGRRRGRPVANEPR